MKEILPVEIFLIIIFGVFIVILIGVVLRMAKTIEQMRQYISELERDNRVARERLQKKGTSR